MVLFLYLINLLATKKYLNKYSTASLCTDTETEFCGLQTFDGKKFVEFTCEVEFLDCIINESSNQTVWLFGGTRKEGIMEEMW